MNFFKSENTCCKPISTLEDLLKWNENASAYSRKYVVQKLNPLYHQTKASNQILVCHDMRNNYLEDKYFQGTNSSDCFNFYHWNLIETFIYFSHHLVTIPPESWINAAHENNTRMLGTFITEFSNGENICKQMFDNIDETVRKLVDLTVHYGFDGWLINIENKIENMDKLKYFVKTLNDELKKIDQNLYKVIWYDSVIESGELKWQNELNSLNKHFFDICDGFFVNYTWKEENLRETKINACERYSDVYVGIDVFGRGCLGDGGFKCNIAFDEIHKHDLSFALFAPGWVHECNEAEQFYQNTESFWKYLTKYTKRRKVLDLPLISNFSLGIGKNFFIDGKQVSTDSHNDWNNFNLQSLMPILSEYDVDWCFDDAFYAGNSIVINQNSNVKIFDLSIELRKNIFYVLEYVFKLGTDLESDLEKFFMSLEYFGKYNLEKKIDFKSNLNDFYENETIELQSHKNSSNWYTRRYVINFPDNVILTSLSAVSKFDSDQTVKIGLVRFHEDDIKSSIENRVDIPKEIKMSSVEYKSHHFQLESQIYLCLTLEWYKRFENAKYFNIFIDKNRNLAKEKRMQNLIYCGSTKIESFSVCMKLNENLETDSTMSSQNAMLSFNIIIQEIDKDLSNLAESNFIFDPDNNDQSNTVKHVAIEIPKLKIKNESDSTFLKNLVFDFECFS